MFIKVLLSKPLYKLMFTFSAFIFSIYLLLFLCIAANRSYGKRSDAAPKSVYMLLMETPVTKVAIFSILQLNKIILEVYSQLLLIAKYTVHSLSEEKIVTLRFFYWLCCNNSASDEQKN